MITNGSFPDLLILDVRTLSEYDSGHIYGSVWIPHTELDARISELAGYEDHDIIVYCRSGVRSVTASGILDSYNFTTVHNMLGGILAWQSAGYPVWFATVHNINTTFNYDTIQAAIDAPQTSDGHTIFVEEGTYYEHVVVYKSLSLVGEDRTKTIIDGNLTEHVIEVTANNIKITGFTIRKSGCGHAAKSGIYIRDYHQNVNVTNNLVIQNGYGIKLDQASNITIASNNITNNDYDGLYLSWSFDNTIFGNNIEANNDHGIWIYYSSNNSIYHNNIVNNAPQVYSYNSVNFWDNGYPCGGNYWADYNGTDTSSGPYQNETGSDGIGDTSYDIDENNHDNYPLMGVFSDFNATSESHVQTICNSSMSDFQFNGTTISFNVSGENGTTSFCRIFIPTALLNGTYKVYVQGTEVPYSLLSFSNITHSYLYFTYEHSTQEVVITTAYYALLERYLQLLANFDSLNSTYYDLLNDYLELQSNYGLLNLTYHELVQNHTFLRYDFDSLLTSYNDLQDQYGDLNSTYNNLLTSYNNLQASYNELQSDQQAIINEIGTIRNLMYIFITATIILIATTVYFAIRKPKIRS